MADRLITSIETVTKGAHAHVKVFVRGGLAGELTVSSPEEADRLKALLMRDSGFARGELESGGVSRGEIAEALAVMDPLAEAEIAGEVSKEEANATVAALALAQNARRECN